MLLLRRKIQPKSTLWVSRTISYFSFLFKLLPVPHCFFNLTYSLTFYVTYEMRSLRSGTLSSSTSNLPTSVHRHTTFTAAVDETSLLLSKMNFNFSA